MKKSVKWGWDQHGAIKVTFQNEVLSLELQLFLNTDFLETAQVITH